MLYSGLTSRQIAWIRSVESLDTQLSADTVAFFLAHTPPAAVSLYNRDTSTNTYAAALSGYLVTDRRFSKPLQAEKHAREMAEKWKADGLAKNIELPAWLLDFSTRESLEEQVSLKYRLTSIVDVRSLYVDESVGSNYFLNEESLVDTITEWLDPDNRLDATLQPLLDAIPESIRTSLSVDDSGVMENGDSDADSDEEMFHEEIRLAWWKAGFTGYLVQVSTPVREYYTEGSDAFTFSWGYTVNQTLYLDNLADRAPIEAWVREVAEEFKAQPRPRAKVKRSKLDPVAESSED